MGIDDAYYCKEVNDELPYLRKYALEVLVSGAGQDVWVAGHLLRVPLHEMWIGPTGATAVSQGA